MTTGPIEPRSTEALLAAPGERLYSMGQIWVKGDDDLIHRVEDEGPQVEPPLLVPVSRLAAGMPQLWDAAFPAGVRVNTEGVCGYIGGGTPHVWSDVEWATAMRDSTAQLRLPIFVRVPPTTRDPVAEADFCIDWARVHDQPRGTLIALDYETAINPWQERFDAQIVKAGYSMILYGTRRTVIQNKRPSGGYWTATWNNIPHLDPGATMTQYGGDVTLGKPYDLNVAALDAALWNVEDGMTLDDWHREITTPGTVTRIALLSLMQRGVNSTIGAQDVDTEGASSPARKAISALVKAEVAPLLDDETKILTAVSAIQTGDPGPLIEVIQKLPDDVYARFYGALTPPPPAA